MAPVPNLPAHESPLRPEFTPAQNLQAQYVGHISASERAKRLHIPTYPIDNVTRDVVADRDDGVFVEAEPRGEGYRVHVTIADVAAHVRARSPLATAAGQRATTEYWPGRTDPMFPRELEERLSLEHNKERLGLTISITLDKHFHPLHTHFTPVMTHPDNSSYAEVTERIREDPQFRLMDQIAGGIRAQYFGKQNAAWHELMERRRRLGQSPQEMAAQEMVATYMLLANNASAEFMSEAALPFIYRNFDETNGDSHAYYSTNLVRHTALERAGLKGAYSHVTSPIRRAPDYFNALMMHYAVDVLEALQQQLEHAYPTANPKALHHALWQHGPDLLKLLSNVDGLHVAVRKKKLMDVCRHVLHDVSITSSKHQLWPALQHLALPSLPYAKAELQQFATHINSVNKSPHMRELAKLTERFEASVEQVQQVANRSEEELSQLHGDRFSSLIAAAAQTGDMPRNLFDETMTRLREGKLDKTTDYFAIFVLAQEPRANRWRALKREVAKRVKHDPSLVNAMVDKLGAHLLPAQLGEKLMQIPLTDAVEAGEEPSQIMAALVTMQSGGQTFAPPFYSVGHDARAARSHANYAFLESYAFGQLQPLAQTAVPNLLYADLEIEGTNRYDLLLRMVKEMGARLHLEEHLTPSGHGVYIRVEGGEVSTPIEVDAIEESSQEAKRVALRRLLRKSDFKSLASQYEQQTGRDMLNPHELLQAMVQQHGGTVVIDTPTRDQRGPMPHSAEVKVLLQGKTYRQTALAPNIDRAKRLASIKMLQKLGWDIAEPEAERAQSWVSDAQVPTRGVERQIFGEGKTGVGR